METATLHDPSPSPPLPHGLLADSGMQARLVRILEATTDFVAISTPSGALTYLNGAAREAAGIGSTAPLEGVNFIQLHPPWAY